MSDQDLEARFSTSSAPPAPVADRSGPGSVDHRLGLSFIAWVECRAAWDAEKLNPSVRAFDSANGVTAWHGRPTGAATRPRHRPSPLCWLARAFARAAELRGPGQPPAASRPYSPMRGARSARRPGSQTGLRRAARGGERETRVASAAANRRCGRSPALEIDPTSTRMRKQSAPWVNAFAGSSDAVGLVEYQSSKPLAMAAHMC